MSFFKKGDFSSMNEKTVHVALPSDQNYVHGLKVTAVSIAVYAAIDTVLHFHVLDGGIDDRSFAEFEDLVKFWHVKTIVTRHRLDENVFKKFPAWGSNKMTYARLLLPKFLEDVDYVVYSDTDILWLAPIEDLWDMTRGDQYLAWVCMDGFEETRNRENDWFVKHGLKKPGDGYFCAGMMLLNLRRFRQEHVVERVFEFIHRNPDILFADQTALNHLLLDQVCLIPKKWQTLTIDFKAEGMCLPVVLHYASEIPWNRLRHTGLLSDTVMLWHRFNDLFVLGGKGESLKRYYKWHQRIYKRVLFLLLLNELFRKAFYKFLRYMRRSSQIRSFDLYINQLGKDFWIDLKKQWDMFAFQKKSQQA